MLSTREQSFLFNLLFLKSKSSNPGRSGVDVKAGSPTIGAWFDPWGSQYRIRIDGDYDNSLANPYADAPGGATLYNGVIVWSFGKNGVLGGGPAAVGFSSSEGGSANNFSGSGDVISWQ
jgi:hypothetical protein